MMKNSELKILAWPKVLNVVGKKGFLDPSMMEMQNRSSAPLWFSVALQHHNWFYEKAKVLVMTFSRSIDFFQ